MNKFLQDFAPSELINAIEDNTIESMETWTKWAKMESHKDPNIIWTASDIPYFIFNLVLPFGNSSAEPGPIIDAARSRARSRNVPTAWWVGPSNPTPDIGSELEENGFVHGAQLTGMAVDLLTLNKNELIPHGLTISRVNNAGGLETWCRIMTSVSEFPDFAAAAFLEMCHDIGILKDHRWHLYVGYLDDTPVSTSALFLSASVAGIYSVTTLPDSRGQGFGTAMTHFPLLDAHSKGFKVGVLFASEMAVNMYRKMGFQEYCTGNIYLLPLAEEEIDS